MRLEGIGGKKINLAVQVQVPTGPPEHPWTIRPEEEEATRNPEEEWDQKGYKRQQCNLNPIPVGPYRLDGKIAKFLPKRGFGFIKCHLTDPATMPRKPWMDEEPKHYRNVFFRLTNLMDSVQEGDEVSFFVVVNEKHKNDGREHRRTEAINVRKEEGEAGTGHWVHRAVNEGPKLWIHTDPQRSKAFRPCAPIIRSGSAESDTKLKNRETLSAIQTSEPTSHLQ